MAALPLAPFFALINNYFEIRIDAQKFVVVQRRAIAERAGDIGKFMLLFFLNTWLKVSRALPSMADVVTVHFLQ